VAGGRAGSRRGRAIRTNGATGRCGGSFYWTEALELLDLVGIESGLSKFVVRFGCGCGLGAVGRRWPGHGVAVVAAWRGAGICESRALTLAKVSCNQRLENVMLQKERIVRAC
jgi:hypothetical protein